MPQCSPTNKPATHNAIYNGPDIPGLTVGKRYDLVHDENAYSCIVINDNGMYFEVDGQEFRDVQCLQSLHKLDGLPACTTAASGPTRVKYIGKADGSAAKDLTIGNTYELDGSFVSSTGKFVKIYRDDAGDPHDVYATHVVPEHACTTGRGRAVPVDPDFDDAIQFSADIGIETITRDAVPEPEGPKSTEDLRAHRYTPDLY